MKKEFFMTLAAVCMVAGLSANQAAQPAAAVAQEKSASSLSADELAFAAKLNDQNRKVFSTQFSEEQRKVAMGASCATGACQNSQKAALAPNDAVQKVMKDNSAVVVEKKEAVQAVQVK
ncbi:MAG: hypothetical protein HYX48_02440 [Chlamydiales bacterium]|nr:hypothetical protein [Chlamydiales bacterium]